MNCILYMFATDIIDKLQRAVVLLYINICKSKKVCKSKK